MMNRLYLSTAVLCSALVPTLALAASAGSEGHHGIPESLTYSAINFGLYVVLLFFLLRKPVRNYFKSRKESFSQALIKAEAARNEAEARKKEINDRLQRLESSSDESIAQARAEAAALRARILQDAEAVSRNLRAEAQRTAQVEIERAKNELREELLSQAVALSRKMLVDKMAEPDQKRLQTEFVDKIQVVR